MTVESDLNRSGDIGTEGRGAGDGNALMSIEWEHDFEQAKRRALQERKTLLINVTKEP